MRAIYIRRRGRERHPIVLPAGSYRPPSITAHPSVRTLLDYIEELPDPPPTRLPWLRRLLWLAADCTPGRLSCLFHDLGWRLP
jgi:hypothetical protein